MQLKQHAFLERLQKDILCSQNTLTIEESRLTFPERKDPKPALRSDQLLYQRKVCYTKTCCCTCHDSSFVQGEGWSLKLPSSSWLWNSCSKASCKNSKTTSIWISLTSIGVPWAIRAGLSYMFSSQQSYISPSLDFQRVVKNTSPGFKLLWELETGQRRDWKIAQKDLAVLFESGQASPRDLDRDGRTWLEVI